MQISNTSHKILSILLSEPDKDFFVNELIRKTGFYPNSIQQSLNTLSKQKILNSYNSGKRRFFRINNDYKNLAEIKRIVGSEATTASKSNLGWVKILNRQTSYSFTIALCVSNMVNLKKRYGCAIPTFWHNSLTFGVYYLKDDLLILGKTIDNLLKSNPNFAKEDIKACYEACDKLVSVAKRIPPLNLIGKSNKELVDILSDFYRYYLEVFPFVTVPHGIERFFENKIREEINDEEILQILMAPTQNDDKERNNALKIASHVKKYGFDNKAKKMIEKHWENFCWIPLWSIYAKPLSYEYFEGEIKNILERVKDPRREIKRLKDEETKAKKKLQTTFREIRATPGLINEVKHLQEYIFLRIYRKNAICQAHYYHLPLLYEAANRLELTSDEIKLLSLEEIIDGLLGKISSSKLKAFSNGRQKGWSILVRDGSLKTICGVKEIIETMERYKIIAPTSAMQRTVKGSVACRGKTIGRVKIVTKLSELNKVEKGDVLVAKMTTPDYMTALHKVSAIVTDEGGITCHAAIVAREFNIPCITATRNATQILADGDLVEVDAVNGIVRMIETIETPEDIKMLNGRMIYKGKAKGIARIVLDASDFGKVQHGDILIAPQTTPEYLSSLYRVKGFIVDENSLTSHAMLYGRALRLPSIMGTNFARNIIKDGDLIELDATKGLIKRLSPS